MNEAETSPPATGWGDTEKRAWLEQQHVQRSYKDDVLNVLEGIGEHVTVERYGALSFDVERYPLIRALSTNWDANKPSVLVTGGVHG